MVADNRVVCVFKCVVDVIEGRRIGEKPRAKLAINEASTTKKVVFAAVTCSPRFVVILFKACIVVVFMDCCKIYFLFSCDRDAIPNVRSVLYRKFHETIIGMVIVLNAVI